MNKLILAVILATGCAPVPATVGTQSTYSETGRWPGSPVVKTLLGAGAISVSAPTSGVPISGTSLCITGKPLDCFNDNGAGTGFLSTGGISSGSTIAIRNAVAALSLGTAGSETFHIDVLGQATSSASSGNTAFGVLTNGARVDFGAGASDYASSDGTTVTFAGPIATTSLKLASVAATSTAPTISSGFGTSPSIAASNGSLAFQVNVGTGGSASSGVIGLPTATTGWVCMCTDISTNSTSVDKTKQTATSTTSCTVGNFSDVSVATAWATGNLLNCIAAAY